MAIHCDSCGVQMRARGRQPRLARCWDCLADDQMIKREAVSLQAYRKRRREFQGSRLRIRKPS